MWNYRANLRDQMLAPVSWRGDETVLDVACGSGMMLNGAALRLTSGRAVGIDIWASHSGGGDIDLLWKNARAEGVADRIEFEEADARQLPFEDEIFDVLFCSGAIHHISHDPKEHRQTLNEMLRVLKPGGHVILWDVAGVIQESASQLGRLGVESELKEAAPLLGYDTSIVIGRK
jgi:ubiquinone/menaquinone biosynthesis C-methylase UbiE